MNKNENDCRVQDDIRLSFSNDHINLDYNLIVIPTLSDNL